jgi:hypothetical protein
MITILEIIGLIIAVGAIITLARGRGASPLIAVPLLLRAGRRLRSAQPSSFLFRMTAVSG